MQYSFLEGIHVEWVHEPAILFPNDKIETAVRVNVCEFDESGNKKAYQEGVPCTENKKYVQDERQWRFIRKFK